ncbi:hypothetical protein TcYC6_0098090 [Trypanosoma cruzi]|nr:hypothetical protein TcYC6_0098090 [Trypanosoma cruzi]
MPVVFYRSVSDGWRVGVAASLDGANIIVRDGPMEETVSSLDIFNPQASDAGSDAQLLLHMSDQPSVFLHTKNAALMSPTPLVGLPPFIELIRYRAANDEFLTSVGDNFFVLLGEGSFTGSNPSGRDIALKAALAWKGSQKHQVVVSCGHALPSLCGYFLDTCCALFEVTPVRRSMIAAGMNVISAFTSTIGRKHLCYLQAQLCIKGASHHQLQDVRFECNHLLVSGIGDTNEFNFKIFSYILYGLSDEERERLYINQKQRSFVCQTSILDTTLVARLQEEYVSFTRATETLGLSSSTLQAIFRQVAAVVHLTEMEFYADGTLSNLSALRGLARLFQLDVEECITIFSSRAVCVAAARLIYRGVVVKLVKKLNAALQFSGESKPLPPSITLVAVPPPPPAESVDLENISLATMYEEMTQAFLCSSDHEVMLWQRAGVRVPEKLQEIFNPLDNYGLLKVLYGLGGVLSVARTLQGEEKMRLALTNCAKSAHVKLNATTLMLTIEHSFGARQYQFPRTTDQLTKLKSVYHAEFTDVRTFLLENADVETQETLHLLAQTENGTAEHVVGEEMLHVKPLLDVMRDDKNMFWWIGGVQLGAGFNGDSVEKQLRETPLRCALELRRQMPHLYITCQVGFIASTFRMLLPPANTHATENCKVAEAILCAAGATYHVTPEGFLVAAGSLVEMHMKVKEHIHRHVTLIQAFARTLFCGNKLKKRAGAWGDLLQKIDLQRKKVTGDEKYRFQNRRLHHVQLLDLMEEENTARSRISEECWGKYISLQHSFQEQMEILLVQVVASSIHKEEKHLHLAMRHNHKEKLRMIEDYIKERVTKHRAHLDSVIEEQLGGKCHQKYTEKLNRAHECLLREREKGELRRKQMESALERKRSKSEASRMAREQEVQEKNKKLLLRQHQSRAVRDKIQQARDDFNETIQAQMLLQDMESKITRQVREEVMSFRRQETDRLTQRLYEERKRREAAAIQAAKINERRSVQRELCVQRTKEVQESRRRHVMQKQLDMQQRQQRAAERLERAREQQRRKVMWEILGAETSLRKLPLYEHRSGKTYLRRNKSDGQLSEPLVLSSGKKAYKRILSESSLRGLLEYHTTKPRANSPYPYATPKR